MIDEILMLPLSLQCGSFIGSVVLGVGLSFAYSLLNAVRKAFEHGVILVAAEDILYCLASSCSVFAFLMYYCHGRLRWYVFAGTALGWIIFRLTAGDLITNAVCAVLSILSAFFKCVIRLVMIPFKAVFGWMATLLTLLAEMLDKFIKKVCNNCKFRLKKHGIALYNLLYTAFYSKRNMKRKDVSSVAKKRKRKSSFFVKMVTFCFIVCAAVAFIQTQAEVVSKRRELAALQQNIKLQQASNDEVKRILEGGNDLEYIERIAREKLGYAYPDEKIFIDRSGS